MAPKVRTSISSQLEAIVKSDDVTNFKNIVKASNCHKFQKQDGNRDNLLHLAIRHNSWNIFSRLASYKKLHFLMEEQNQNGETALVLAVNCYRHREKNTLSLCFVQRLLDLGADYDYIYPNGDSLLTKLLKEAVNSSYFWQWGRNTNIDDLILLLLYYGASPWTKTDHSEDSNLNFELAATNCDNFLIEVLFLYTFSEDSSFVMDLGTVARLLSKNFPHVFQVLKCIKSFRQINYGFHQQELFYRLDEPSWSVLLKIPGVHQLFSSQFECDYHRTSLDTLGLVFERLKFFVAKALKSTRTLRILQDLLNTGKSEEEVTQYFCFLLSYGLKVSEKSLQLVWKKYGDCPLFRIMLHMDFQMFRYRPYHDRSREEFTYQPFPELLYNLNVDIYDCIKYRAKYKFDRLSFGQLLDHSALPQLKGMFQWTELPWMDPEREYVSKIESLPDVPLLQELARNCLKKFLVAEFKVKTPRRYYMVVKSLPVPEVIKEIITFERALY